MASETIGASPTPPDLIHRRQKRSVQTVSRLPWNFAEWFILSQTILPAFLYLPGSQRFRVLIRIASYGISLTALGWWMFSQKNIRVRPHPAVPWLLAALAYLLLMLFHPATNSLLSGAAQIALYLSVLAPVFWAPSLVEGPARLQRLLWLLLLCNGINAFVGVMQVQDPDTWMPREFSSVIMESDYGLGTALYEGAKGQTIIRPPGLGDAPGAVCGPAVFALYLGLIFAVIAKQWWQKIAAGLFAACGAAAIFLSLVRSSLLIALGAIVVYWLLQIRQQRMWRAGWLLAVGILAIGGAYIHSAATGGENLTERFKTIIADDPSDFYYQNRGNQVEAGFVDLLPQYPFGAGLGRWGMMNSYFGNPNNVKSPSIWVEIQWPGWIVDGGIILLFLYPVAIFSSFRQEFRLTNHSRDPSISTLAGIILCANAGLLALCFSYPVFLSPVGMQFWFLSGALDGASRSKLKISMTRSMKIGSASQLP